jgi:hypothetical protein
VVIGSPPDILQCPAFYCGHLFNDFIVLKDTKKVPTYIERVREFSKKNELWWSLE